MPTVFIQKGYRFFFYSVDLNERIHIHIEKSDRHAKYWLQPLELAINGGFRDHELSEIERIINRHSGDIVARWEEEQRKRDNRHR
jgi:hypothetical protein